MDVIDRMLFADSLEIALGGGCGLCGTERLHLCAGCGRCRCYDHDTCVYRRVSLVQAAKCTTPASAALLGRVLPSADQQRSDVAAFQSSI